MRNNDDKYRSDSDPDLEELRKAWENLQESLKSKKPADLPEVDEINKGLEALHQDQKENTPAVLKPKKQNRTPNAPQKVLQRIKVNSPKKRGLLGKIIHHIYVQTTCGGIDPEAPTCKADGMDIETAIGLAARHAYMDSEEYKRQQLADMIAQNQEELTRRTISQGMTWLVPRFEDKLDEISQKIKKDW